MSADDRQPQPPGPVQDEVSTARLLATLGIAGALAGLLIVFVYQATLPAIEAHKQAVLEQAIYQVLGDPDRFETFYVTSDGLATEPPEDADPRELERIYLGYRGDVPVGYAIAAGEPGFQDMVRLLFGYDVASRRLLGMTVLESKETPGLGDKIEKDAAFIAQFAGAVPPLETVKQGQGKNDPSKIDAITGATISSRTVVRAIDRAVARLEPRLGAGAPETGTGR